MAVSIVRLGSARNKNEGSRLGTVRRLPRGVKKADYARRGFFDVWLPELAPSDKLLRWALAQPWTEQRWTKFTKDYRREMQQPTPRRLLDLFARLSWQTNFSVGCYCEDEEHCHRSVLRALLREHGARLSKD